MTFFFHPRAEDEFEEAVRYYEDCQTGLGLEFAEEVYAVIQRISSYPGGLDSLVGKYAMLPYEPVSFPCSLSSEI